MKRLSFLFLALLQAALASFPNQGGGKISPLSSSLFAVTQQHFKIHYSSSSFSFFIVLWGEKFCTSLRDGPFSKFGLELTLTFMEQILHKSRVEAISYLCDINTHKSCLDSHDFMGHGSPTSWSKILI